MGNTDEKIGEERPCRKDQKSGNSKKVEREEWDTIKNPNLSTKKDPRPQHSQPPNPTNGPNLKVAQPIMELGSSAVLG